jgi:hypothetical protein
MPLTGNVVGDLSADKWKGFLRTYRIDLGMTADRMVRPGGSFAKWRLGAVYDWLDAGLPAAQLF